MSYRNQLFRYKKLYDIDQTNTLFFKAIRECCEYHYKHCKAYRQLLDDLGFHPSALKNYQDIEQIPFIPTLYFKHHRMFSMPNRKMVIRATSSGTSGQKSLLGFNLASLKRALQMAIRVGKYHHLLQIKPVHYIIFGYEPNKHNQTVISKSAYASTYYAPSLSRIYALTYRNGEYHLDLERLKQAFIRYSKGKCPIRTIGFPAYTYFLLKQMKEEGIRLKMPKGSLVTIGGGWKQFYAEKVEKQDFYQLVNEVLGIDDQHIVEYFSAVEHPILYTDCKHHHFHIPIYSRVIIRDVDTLAPLGNDQIGLIQFLTPMVDSVPLVSVMTDDLGRLHTEPCGCGIESPWLEIMGRVGVKDIVTCAAGAAELLKDR
ncbi:MAG: hypothetical protein NC182_03170 [Prevotella sp.]|nr:hypothetical protein [Staphylococcus sp.]MCM1350177.1 hypothetical protein [Prevotella sp.]